MSFLLQHEEEGLQSQTLDAGALEQSFLCVLLLGLPLTLFGTNKLGTHSTS